MSTKICFVALVGYPLLSGKAPENIMGPSVHQVLLARELVKYDFDVSYIAYNEGGPLVEHIDGIKIIKTYCLRDVSHLNPGEKELVRNSLEEGDGVERRPCRIKGRTKTFSHSFAFVW
ncbi:hypothetical protein ACFLSK_02880 [Chloroflexota bacterium]